MLIKCSFETIYSIAFEICQFFFKFFNKVDHWLLNNDCIIFKISEFMTGFFREMFPKHHKFR